MEILKKLIKKSLDNWSVPPINIVFLGDSVTQGCFEIYYDYKIKSINTYYDFQAVYHNRLKNMIADFFSNTPVNIINAGISGDNAVHGLQRLEKDVIAYSPDLVVICYGLNDVNGGIENLEVYQEALEGMFKKLKKNNIECIFMTPNMMNTYVDEGLGDKIFLDIAEQTAKLQNNGIMDAYMDCARTVCHEENIPVCDCYEKWKKLYKAGVDTTSLLSNGINHPTRDLHKLFAQSILDIILFREN